MSSPTDKKTQEFEKKKVEILALLGSKLDEIYALTGEPVQASCLEFAATHGLKVWAKGKSVPVLVPDAWIDSQATLYGPGSKPWIINKVRELGVWSEVNTAKRKYEKNVFGWLAKCIARDWAKTMGERASAREGGDLGDYERRNPVND